MGKITRVRTGCWTCKERRKKCDETKPECLNCVKAHKECKGYGVKLVYDFESDNFSGFQNFKNEINGTVKYGFTGRPRSKTSKVKSGEVVGNGNVVFMNSYEPNVQNQVKEEVVPVETNSNHENPIKQDVKLRRKKEQILDDHHQYQDQSHKENTPSNMKMFNTFRDYFDESKKKNSIKTTDITFQLTDKIAEPNMDYTPIEEDTSHIEETKMLHHFFKKLVPLIDVHPNSPWPDLTLKYCDFELAKSCFLSLSYVHKMGDAFMNDDDAAGLPPSTVNLLNSQLTGMETKMTRTESNELLAKSAEHINNSLDYIVTFLEENKLFDDLRNPNISVVDFQGIIEKLKKESLSPKIFVILLLIFIQILYAILDSGRSAIVRLFLKLFASIIGNKDCKAIVDQIDQSESLIVLLSYFDTIMALSSPDCRLPYVRPSWFGERGSLSSIEDRMSLPIELCECMFELCHLRNNIQLGYLTRERITKEYHEIQAKLYNYRDFVSYNIESPPTEVLGRRLTREEYLVMRIKAAQLWSLAISTKLLSVCKPTENFQEKIDAIVYEFLDVYSTMDPNSQQLGQMIWPMIQIGIECRTPAQRAEITRYIKALYKAVKASNLNMMLDVLERCWEADVSLEEHLSGKEWLHSGIELVPL